MKRLAIAISSLIVIALCVTSYFMLKRGNGEVGRDFDAINEDKVLHVVTNLVPIGYFVSGDTIAGYNHDLLAALQTYTDIRFDVKVENSLEKSFEGLKKGKYDLVARNIPINANLRDEYGFTEPILYNKLILVQRKAEFNDGIQPIRNHLQLAKKTICVPKESPSIFRLQNLSHEIGDTIFVNEDNTYEAEQLAMMVADKEIDFTVCDGKTAAKLSANIPELDVSTDIGFTHLEGWATRNNSPVLLDSLNVWINRFKKTKAYSAILRKYYRQ